MRRIRFEDSPGGNLAAVHAYVRLIRSRGLDTVAWGKCYSACAIAFLAGRTRKVGWVPTVLFFHLARYTKDGRTWPAPNQDEVLGLIDALSGCRLRGVVRERIAVSWRDGEGVAFAVYPLLERGAVTLPLYCDGSQGLALERCQLLSDADPYDLGILTRVDVPARALGNPMGDPVPGVP